MKLEFPQQIFVKYPNSKIS